MKTDDTQIVVGGEDLYGLEGVYAGFEERLYNRERERSVPPAEKRHILIGEIGEFAVILDLKKKGFEVEHLSKKEFEEGIAESSTDIIARKDGRELKIQVKASEVGNRCIENRLLCKYERDGVDLIVFVAVRQVPDYRGIEAHFTCQINAVIPPRQIRLIGSWNYEHGRWLHINNAKFMRRWEAKTNEQIEMARCAV